MLEAIVEDVDRRAELAFGERAGQIAIGADHHDDAGHGAREHQRLVAGRVEAGADARAVRDDRDAGRSDPAAVAAREDRGTLAARHEQAREVLDDRGLPGAADAKVADADHRTPEPLLPVGMARVPRAPPAGGGPVQSAEGLDQSVHSPERADDAAGTAGADREQLADDGERLVLGAAVGFDQRPRRRAEARAVHRIAHEREDRVVELLIGPHLERRAVGEKRLARSP